MSYLSISTWSLHRLLGPLRWTAWDADGQCHVTHEQAQPEQLSLLQLPHEAARRGYAAIEVCHFHFPSVDAEYLAQVREAFESSGVSFDTLLLDYGDLTTEDAARLAADLSLMRDWIETAALCGAKQIRMIAGEAEPTDRDALHRASRHLLELSEYAAARDVIVVTENFKKLTSTGEACSALMALTGDRVRWITDFGNFGGANKYEELHATLGKSVSVHAKAAYDDRGMPDREEFERCLDESIQSGFDGAYVMIYDGPGDMWEGLARVRDIVSARLGAAS
ncbi:sugar phosphate isomerase/epimerase family protein [Cohnella sp. 56]|uniref:sugar phosphate isomerase/epimerase family protein n=1 Tax=Cohnella sp. 56 TaxID=3113722 RepID=UPI0030E8951F